MRKLISRQSITLSILILLSILYFSCDDSGIIQKESPYNVSGQISGWVYGSTFTLNAIVEGPTQYMNTISSCPIDENGNFSMNLPATLADSFLISPETIFLEGMPGGNTIFTPASGKARQVLVFYVKSGDTIKGQVHRGSNTPPLSTTYSLIYIYADDNITANGTRVSGIDSVMFDGTINKGWGKFVINLLKSDSTGYKCLWNNIEPSGGFWIYSGIWK